MTAIQMKYLLTLVGDDSRKLTLSSIAMMYGVNKSTVSRSLAMFIEKGVLDKDYNLTIYGTEYVKTYKDKYDNVRKWLIRKGVAEENATNDTYEILANCSDEMISVLNNYATIANVCDYLDDNNLEGNISGADIVKFFPEGEYKLSFTFMKNRNNEQVSMANEAFEHPLVLSVKKNNSYVKLKIKDVKRRSKLGNLELVGRMQAMRYKHYDYDKESVVSDGMVFVPLEAFSFFYEKTEKILIAELDTALSCSVGKVHMPESIAKFKIYVR